MQDNAEANAQALETYLLHDESLELTTLRKFITDNNFETLPWQQLDQIPDDARVLLYISDSRIRELMPMAIARQWQVGILNHPEARQTAGALGVPGNLIKDIKHYLRCKAIKVDVLTCNDRLVLSSVIIGDSFTQHPFDVDYRPTRLDRVAAALKAIKHLRLRGFKLTTGKGQKIQLAALGLWVTKNARSGLLGQSLSEAISTADGRFTLVALSPRSVLSYLWLLLRILFPKKIDPARLPASVGMMRNRQTHLESDDEIEYLIDGQRESASTIDLKIDEQGMYLLPGP
jgi:hypothetical protein